MDNKTLFPAEQITAGLSKREIFTLFAMNSIMSYVILKDGCSQVYHESLVAEQAVKYADTVLKKLSETK